MLPQGGHLRALACALLIYSAVPASGEVRAPPAAERFEEDADAAGYYRRGRAYELGQNVDKDLFEAARQYQLAAQRGHLEAQFSLALLLVGAVPDSPRNPRKSFEWFSQAAQRGHGRAAFFLALSYQTGAGTETSSEKAFEWYRRSATHGSGEAMNALARMYAAGDGILLNLPNAYAWNEVAYVRGYELATQYRASLEDRMSREDLVRGKKLMRGLMKKYGGGSGGEVVNPSPVQPKDSAD